MAGRDICCIPECEEDVKYIHLQVCSACYSGLALWRGRTPAQKKRRMEINRRLVSRMGFIMDNPKHHPKKMPRRDDLDHGDKKVLK